MAIVFDEIEATVQSPAIKMSKGTLSGKEEPDARRGAA